MVAIPKGIVPQGMIMVTSTCGTKYRRMMAFFTTGPNEIYNLLPDTNGGSGSWRGNTTWPGTGIESGLHDAPNGVSQGSRSLSHPCYPRLQGHGGCHSQGWYPLLSRQVLGMAPGFRSRRDAGLANISFPIRKVNHGNVAKGPETWYRKRYRARRPVPAGSKGSARQLARAVSKTRHESVSGFDDTFHDGS